MAAAPTRWRARAARSTLAPRQVTIDALRLLVFTASSLTLEVTCSKGTYIRALARDIAVALGTVGHLSALMRTRVGAFRLADALTLDALAAGRGRRTCCSPVAPLPDAPTFTASRRRRPQLLNGQPVPAPRPARATASGSTIQTAD